MADVQVKGLKQLNEFLQQLPAKVEANVLRAALRQGAKLIEADAKARVPVNTGRLRDSIRVTTRLKNGRAVASVTAGGRSGDKQVLQGGDGRLKVGYKLAFYAAWVEFGTSSHKITARAGGFLQIAPGLFAHSVEHPGSKPKPFMRPAMDANAGAAVVAAANYMKKRLSTKEGLESAADVEVEAR